jgi:predicted acylesterase/phospholipase RssA
VTNRRKGIALAGGGPVGGIYELGALLALDEALRPPGLLGFDIFVGVSSGALFAAGLANDMSPRAMYDLFIEKTGTDEYLEPKMLLRPAFGEFADRLSALIPLLLRGTADFIKHPWETGHFLASFERLSWAIPTGVLNSVAIADYLGRLFSVPGRTNDFRQLRRKLFVVATDLDSGDAVAFGSPGADDVPISQAVQASTALPGLFPPVAIGDRNYVDGILRKTLHASVALQEGAELVVCINPLVPFRERRAKARRDRHPSTLQDRGLPLVLSQTLRAIIHSRMLVGMGRYRTEFPEADVVLVEPSREDHRMFFTNVLSFAERRELSRHAYQQTRKQLRRRYAELAPVFARHGLYLDRAVLDAERSEPLPGQGRPPGRRPRLDEATRRLQGVLDQLDGALARTAQS